MAPAVLLLIFSSIQAALYYYGRVVAQQAAREGVSLLRLAQDESRNDEIADLVESYARTVGRETLIDPRATPTYPVDGGDTVTVSVAGEVISLVPGLDLTVRQSVSGTIERFERDDRPR